MSPSTALPVVPPADSVEQTTITQRVSTEKPSWLSGQLRNLIALGLLGVICFLALSGIRDAQMAIIQAFTMFAAFLWGERAALKTPGKDL